MQWASTKLAERLMDESYTLTSGPRGQRALVLASTQLTNLPPRVEKSSILSREVTARVGGLISNKL